MLLRVSYTPRVLQAFGCSCCGLQGVVLRGGFILWFVVLMLVMQGGGFILWFEGGGVGLWLQVVGQTVKMGA